MIRHQAMGVGFLGRAVLYSVLAFAVAGCQSLKDGFGVGKHSPDEFAVVTRAPLEIPPNFALRPPDPGAARPQESSAVQRAQAALTGAGQRVSREQERKGNRSAGESALLDQAGTDVAKPDIREVINSENAVLADTDGSLVDRLVFWQTPDALGSVIDANKESRRLKENAALGNLPTEGATPVIKRRQKAILEDLF